MINGIRWIFFDVGSTLTDESEVHRAMRLRAAKESDVSYERIVREARSFYKKGINGDKEIYRRLKLPFNWDSSLELIYPEVREALSLFRAKYRLGIIANQLEGLSERLKSFGILSYFDLVVSSFDVGLSKPSEEIFRFALSESGCSPKESAMVGDRTDNDIVPAKKIGMKSVRVLRGEWRHYEARREEEKADYECFALDEAASCFLS